MDSSHPPVGDADHTLEGCLNAARKALGSPSLRTLAARTDYSHTTIAKAFTPDAATLSWPIVEQVAAAVGADLDKVAHRWASAKAADAVGDVPSPNAQRLPLLLGLAVVFAGGVALVIMQAVDTDTTRSLLITDLVQLAFVAAAAVLFAWRAHTMQSAGDILSNRFFGLLAGGALGWVLGETVWIVARQLQNEAIPGGFVHDIGFLATPICMSMALWLRADRYGLGTWRLQRNNVVTFLGIIGCPYVLCVGLLVALGLRADGAMLVYSIYPAADIAMAMMALAPMICGHRIVTSVLLSAGLLGAAASDLGYLLLRANPTTTAFPAPAALGFVAFAIILSVYALIERPLPDPARRPVPVRIGWPQTRSILAVGTAITASIAIIGSAVVIATTPSADTQAVMVAVTVATTTALALSGIRQAGR